LSPSIASSERQSGHGARGEVRNAGVAPASVLACLAELGEDASSWQGIVAQRDNSRVHRARAGNREVAIKECFAPKTRDADRALARREFAALRRVAERAGAGNAAPLAPLPLVLCDAHGAYAMTWVYGRPATQALWSSRARDDAARIGRLAGGWLRQFHALHERPRRTPDFHDKLRTVREIATTRGDDPLAARAARILVARADAAAAVEMPASWIHGDMKTDNLLVDGDAVAGLDLQIADDNVVAYDLAPFLNHLTLLRWSPRGITRGAMLKEAAAAFLRAYSDESAGWVLPVEWLRAYLLLQPIARSPGSRGVRARVAAWTLRAALAGVLDRLEHP
jgi:aminoglycoside phosphotransferase (APT) family kinase protein